MRVLCEKSRSPNDKQDAPGGKYAGGPLSLRQVVHCAVGCK